MAPQLTDDVVVLVMMSIDDAAALVAGEDDDIVDRLSAGPSTLATAERRIRTCAADWHGDWFRPGAKLTWGIRDAATDVLAGTAEVQLRNPELAAGAANLSYSVFPCWRGHRYGARAVGLMCDFLASETGTTLAVLRIDPDNTPSLRVAEDSGFRRSPELAAPGASMLWCSRALPRR